VQFKVGASETNILRDFANQGKSNSRLEKFNDEKFKSELEDSSGLLSRVHGEFLNSGQFDNSIVLRV